MQPEEFWMEAAGYREDYARWMEAVDSLCDRFCDISLADINEELDSFECFEAQMPPETFFKEAVIPHLRNDQGCDYLDSLIGAEAMWGAKSWIG